jgi:hypothetical protein
MTMELMDGRTPKQSAERVRICIHLR